MLADFDQLEQDLQTYKAKIFNLENKDRMVCLGSAIRE